MNISAFIAPLNISRTFTSTFASHLYAQHQHYMAMYVNEKCIDTQEQRKF